MQNRLAPTRAPTRGSLISRGLLTIVDSVYDDQAFGNAAVTLEGSTFHVRLVRDRSQIVAEIACSCRLEDWFPLQRILRLAVGSLAPPEGIVTVDEAAVIVERFYDNLRDACSPANAAATRAQLAELEKQAMKAFLERVKKGRN